MRVAGLLKNSLTKSGGCPALTIISPIVWETRTGRVKMSETAQEKIKWIENQLDEALIQRLVLYAAQKMARHYWQGVLGGEPPGGEQAMDFVEQAIQKTIKGAEGIRDSDGYRDWDHNAQPNLYLHLKSVVDSDINHLAESWENKHFRSAVTLKRVTDDGEEIDGMAMLPADAILPGDSCAQAEQEQARENVLFEFVDFVSDDPQLTKVLELLFADVKKSDLAARLSLSPKEMYVVTKRMDRRVNEFKRKKSKIISEIQANA
jgi:hypothetical protein